MKELENEVVSAFRALEQSGGIKTTIAEAVERTVHRALEDELGPYSSFGKALREAIKVELRVEDGLGLGGYNAFVADVVRAKLRSALEGRWREHMEAELDKFLAAAPPVVKLSDLVERMVEDAKYEAEGKGWEEPTVVLEKSKYGGWMVRLDPEPRKSSYLCRYTLHIAEDGKVFHTNVRNGEPCALERTFFQFRAAGTRLEVDEYDAKAVAYPHCSCD